MPYGTANVDVIQSSVANTPVQFNDGNGTQIGTLCRAWVNFNGVSGSVAVRASFNVSSITRNGTGDYTVNFTNAFSDTNYAVVGTSNAAANTGKVVLWSAGTAPTTTAVRIFNDIASNLTGQDSSIMNVAVFR